MIQTISLVGQLQQEYKKVKEQYAIYHHSNNAERATYYLGKMDGIEAAIKVIAMREAEAK
jgi:hypothetical protein